MTGRPETGQSVWRSPGGRVLRVGLTGGIGAGKSEVSRRLAARGAVVIDADAVAREVVAPGTPGLAAVAEAFGAAVLRADGTLDRDRLGEIVFADAALREKLNAIIHPRVGERMRELEQAAGEAIVVHDVPLLTEIDLAGAFDVVVVVDVPPYVQVERLARERGMTTAAAQARIRAQVAREQRLAIASIVVDNSGSLADLDQRVGELWAELCRRAAALRS
jgi:dephospho-CoA kinase